MKLEITYKKLDELSPYENNPRFNDGAVKYVVNSIREYGFLIPILIDEGGEIIAGHTRYKAAKELGMEEVPCVIASTLSGDQIKQFRLVDNRVGEMAAWDYKKLVEELDDIDLDMSDFGFNEQGVDFDWDEDVDLSPDSYEEPEARKLQCPMCNGIDFAVHFKKVDKPEKNGQVYG